MTPPAGRGGERVRYKLMTDDLRFLSLGLNLKYHF